MDGGLGALVPPRTGESRLSSLDSQPMASRHAGPLRTPSPVGGTQGVGADVRDLLLSITRQMVAATDLDHLLQTIVDAAMTIVPMAEKSVIHLLDDAGSHLVARYCSDPQLIDGSSPGRLATAGIAGRAFMSRRLVCVGDTQVEPEFRQFDSGSDLRSLMVAPLHVAETSLGTLSLNSS